MDGIVSLASVSALCCIQQISPSRTTTNGWVSRKTADGKFLEEKCNALLKAIPVVKTDNDDDLLYHVVKGRAMVVVVKCAGSRFVLLVDSKLSLKYNFHSLGWLNVRKNSSISAKGTLREDVECDSPSMAAALVAGGFRNGLTFWKNKDWKTLKSLK